jgi:predicted alpha/beta superfamily hydrolase
MRLKLLFQTILFLNFYLISAQEHPSLQTESSFPLIYGQQETFYSEILGENRTINISLPESFSFVSKQHSYPTLLLLEDEFFLMTSGVVKHLSSVERMPETIVVSILDMTYSPTVHTNGSTFWPTEKLWDEDPEPFTKHLKEELFPYLEKKYRANDFRMIMGLSPTAIYTLHAFVKEPELFNAHIAIAAGDILGMGYNSGERFIDLIEQSVINSPDHKRFLYVTSSDSDGGGKSPEIFTNLIELDRILNPLQSENFKSISRVFPNEGHYDVALPALMEALGMVFPKEHWFARYRDIVAQPGNAMNNIDAYYEALSNIYDFQILPRAERWHSVNSLSWIGPYLCRKGRVVEGIELLERWVDYRPESVMAHTELAKAYENNNQLEKAIQMLIEAYALSLETQNPDSESLKLQIEKFENQKD